MLFLPRRLDNPSPGNAVDPPDFTIDYEEGDRVKTVEATPPTAPPVFVTPKHGNGLLSVGGQVGNRGGYGERGKGNWLQKRMAAALRAGNAPKVALKIMTEGARDQDRLRAIDLMAELADLKPRKDAEPDTIPTALTGDQRLAALLDALPMALQLVDSAQRQRITQALTSITPTP